jgi:hypothetical protein
VTEQTPGAGEGQQTQGNQQSGTQQGSQQGQQGQEGQQSGQSQQSQQSNGQQQGSQGQQQSGQQQAAVSYPADWREKWSGGDEKELKRLQRFTSPDAVFKSFREIETKFSTAKLRTELPANPTPEQIAEYRRENGVPEEPTKYYDGIKNVVIGEEDRPIVNKFLEKMHGANASVPVVEAALSAYYAIQEEQQAADIDAQKLYRTEQEDILREAWGTADFRSNLNAIRNTMASMPDSLKEGLESWVDHNGNLLMNNAEFLQWIGSVSRELNPAGVVVPGGSGDQMQNIDQELAKFGEMRRSNIDAWSRNEPAQKRERELLAAKEKLSARGR